MATSFGEAMIQSELVAQNWTVQELTVNNDMPLKLADLYNSNRAVYSACYW